MPVVSTPAKLTTVSDAAAPCVSVAVTDAPLSVDAVNARQISLSPRCVFVRLTSVHVSPPPVTPLTVLPAVRSSAPTKATSSSLAPLVEKVGEVIVVVVVDLSVNTLTSSVGAPLPTVTVTFADVATLPAASRARAASVCAPLAVVIEFHDNVNGEVSTSAPSAAPSSRNCTPATPLLSDAFADTVTPVPDTMALLTGAVIDTVGGVTSGLFTVTVTGADVVVLADGSRTISHVRSGSAG